MKKILCLMIIFISFVSCKKDSNNDREITSKLPEYQLEFSNEEKETIKTFSSKNFEVIKIINNDNHTLIVEIKIKFNYYGYVPFSLDLIKDENIIYPFDSVYSMLLQKKLENGKVIFSNKLHKINHKIYENIDIDLEKTLLSIDEFFNGLTKEKILRIKTADFDQYGKEIFTEEESEDSSSILYSQEKRGFFMNNILSIKEVIIDEKKHLRVYNPLPHNFSNLYVLGEVGEETLVLFRIDSLKMYSENFYPFEFFETEQTFLDTRGNTKINEDINNIDRYKLYSSDKIFEKLSKITATNKVRFGYRVVGKWSHLQGEHARKYMPGLANIYYMLSTERFYERFMSEDTILTHNDGTTLLSREEKERVYNKYTTRRFEINLLTNTEGMAETPGYFVGIGDHKFAQFYRNDKGDIITGAVRTWAHEIGHNAGFHHSSNMTYEKDIDGDGKKDGATVVWQKVYKELYEEGELPFLENPFE